MEVDELLPLILAHIEKAEISETRFGLDALGDPNFVADLRAGRELRRKTKRRVMEFIVSGKPRETKAEAA